MLNETSVESGAPVGVHQSKTARVPWVESIKALALVWIFLNHVAERLFGSPLLGNPDKDWPAISERLAQLRPLADYGILNLPLTIVRDIGWLGDQGVTLFLMLSGFGLAWGCLGRDSHRAIDWPGFYRRRLGRILPIWVAAHICFLLPFAVLGVRLSLLDSQFYWSLLGIRVLPSQLYYGVAAWWYVTLLLQLYLVFPFLWTTLRHFGEMRLLMLTLAIAIPLRAAGLFYFHDYLDAWNRGAIFASRLPEFVFGVVAASWYYRRRSEGGPQLSRPVLSVIGLMLFAAGTAASFSLAGMAAAPLVSGVGALLLFYSLCATAGRLGGVLDWIGRHSLSLFLVHQVFVQVLIPRAGSNHSMRRVLAGILLSLVLTVAAALILEKITEAGRKFVARGVGHIGAGVFTWRLAAAAGMVWAILIAGELVIRRVNPQEPWDLGWGERASLQPDDSFGWKLKPSSSTQLRWESYDYRVTANSLGFPGAEYSVQKPSGIFRVLVTGDAFASAEGVNTDQSWPRLLERDLNSTGSRLHSQVLDFAITGYGPNQYNSVVARFAPIYRPDAIVIGLFVNDYGDVLTTNDEFRRAIGFGKADPRGLASIVTFRHLGALVRDYGTRFICGLLGRRDPSGYFLGQFHFLEKDNREITGEGQTLVADRLRDIKEIANRIGAQVLIAMVPAAPQVCGPDSLPYWPKHTDISDAGQFDMDLPQRVTKSIGAKLSIAALDLRIPLAHAAAGCPYQPRNMHWTGLGHRLVAEYVASVLAGRTVTTR